MWALYFLSVADPLQKDETYKQVQPKYKKYKQEDKMKTFTLKRDKSNSVLSELRTNGISQQDFLDEYPAREVHPKAVPMAITKAHVVKQKPLLYRDEKGIFLDSTYFNSMKSISVSKLQSGSSFILGQLKAEIEWETLVRFLIESDIICTYIHIESSMVVKMVSKKRAEVSGSHIYFTNEKNESPFSFVIEQDHTNNIYCFGK